MADGIFNQSILKKTYNTQLTSSILLPRKNKEDDRIYFKKYYWKHKEQIKEHQKLRHSLNREKDNERNRGYRLKHLEERKIYEQRPDIKQRSKERSIRINKETKIKVLNHYGLSCVCCGIDIIEFLSIHHMDAELGREHRRNKIMGSVFYGWLIKNNFPKGFKTMCMNCNHAMGRRNSDGICPHQRVRVV